MGLKFPRLGRVSTGRHTREDRTGEYHVTPPREPKRYTGRRRAAPGRHRRKAETPAVWYPTMDQWRQLYDGQTVQGYRLTRAGR